ncbi:unnamed protein product [Eruca vesicaria subsp. sativa]|uniref:Pentatricopeptide repeat-containing protein n=1 Tax=Eruca vesicaria subsp. sativa TaxID=29727 RepID=A0ABC8M5F8_ERUVS|nr:unnamed protein product [Eruca vesicaria subsp. sativa]
MRQFTFHCLLRRNQISILSGYSRTAARLSSTTNPPEFSESQISPDTLLDSIRSSQWHFVEHFACKLTPSLISTTLLNLVKTPALALDFVNRIDPRSLELPTQCLAIALVSKLSSHKPALQLLNQVVTSNKTKIRDVFNELVLARDRVQTKSTILLDLLVRSCCQLKMVDEAIECFYLMKEIGFDPKIETCNAILSLLSRLNLTEKAWVLYADMYRMETIKSNIYTYNIMINVLCKEGKLKKAKEMLGMMECFGVKPNIVTYNTLVQGYSSRGRVEGARMVIREMKSKGFKPDLQTYNPILSWMCCEGGGRESDVLREMKEVGLVPDSVSYNILIRGCSNRGDLETAFAYRDEMMKKGFEATFYTYNTLIHGLFMENKVEAAEMLVKEIREKGVVALDAVTYNILINGYCQHGDAKKAFALHDEMITDGIEPTQFTYTSLIYVLCRRRRMREADELFENVVVGKRMKPDRVMYNALMDGHCSTGNMDRAFSLLKEMDKMRIDPDDVTYNCLMRGLCGEGKFEEAREIMGEMKRRGIKPDHISYNTLISGYSKKGDTKQAFMVRDEMLSLGFNPTLLTYNALLKGLSKNQDGRLAEELLLEMKSEGITPNDSSYCSVLEAMYNAEKSDIDRGSKPETTCIV